MRWIWKRSLYIERNSVISTVLDDTEGVVAVKTGHVATHEAGAIEHSGHKVLTLPEHQGKMDVNELRDYLYAFLMMIIILLLD